MSGVKKHAYKHLDDKKSSNYNNAVIELNMEDLAKMVFNSNHGIHRFISEYSDLCSNSPSLYDNILGERLLALIENHY